MGRPAMVGGRRRVRARRGCWISFILDWCRLIFFSCSAVYAEIELENVFSLFYEVKVFIVPFQHCVVMTAMLNLTTD